MAMLFMKMLKCSKPLLPLILVKYRRKALPLLTNVLSYQQNRVFPLLLLAWLHNPYKFVKDLTKMFNQFINN